MPFLLIGGRGLEAHGYVRNTRDLDLLVPLDESMRMTEILREFGYARTAESPIFSRWISPDPSHEDLDLLYVDPETFRKLASDAVTLVVGETEASVPSVGGMVALKLHAMRNNPERIPRDTLDIQALLRLRPAELDLVGLRELCERYGPNGIFDAIHRPIS